jgi:hypothetical protein
MAMTYRHSGRTPMVPAWTLARRRRVALPSRGTRRVRERRRVPATSNTPLVLSRKMGMSLVRLLSLVRILRLQALLRGLTEDAGREGWDKKLSHWLEDCK